jgi:twitching motility protein PilT
VSNLIREGKAFQIPSMMQTGRASGMATLNDSLFELVKKKVVEPKEAWMKAIAKADFKALLDRANIRVDLED